MATQLNSNEPVIIVSSSSFSVTFLSCLAAVLLGNGPLVLEMALAVRASGSWTCLSKFRSLYKRYRNYHFLFASRI